MKLQRGLPVLQAVCMYIMSTACSNPVLEVECSGSWPACAQCERVRPCTLCHNKRVGGRTAVSAVDVTCAICSSSLGSSRDHLVSEGLCELGGGKRVVLALASLQGMFPCTKVQEGSKTGQWDRRSRGTVCARVCVCVCVCVHV